MSRKPHEGDENEDSEGFDEILEMCESGEARASGDARTEMIQAVKDATDAGEFPTVLVTIGPPPEGEPPGSQIGVYFDPANDRDYIIDLLLSAADAVIGERH